MTKTEKQHITRFLKKLLLLLVICFIVDRTLGTIVERLYVHVPQGDIKTFSHTLNKPKEDVFLFGSSRVVHGYDPRVFTDTLGYSCFNSGRENSTILYHTTILDAAIKKHVPKIIVLDVTPKELSWRAEENSKLVLASMILPYVGRDTAYENIAKELFPRELMKAKVSKLYAYNSMILPILMAKFSEKKKGSKDEIINGYLPIKGSKIKKGLPQAPMSLEDMQTDSAASAQFEKFLQLCRENNIRLYITEGPIYVQKIPETPSITEMKKIMAKYDIEFCDHSYDTAFLKKDYFYDNVHLNAKGANLFSAFIAKKIKDDLVIHPLKP